MRPPPPPILSLELLTYVLRGTGTFSGLTFVIVAHCPHSTTLFALTELWSAGIDFGIESLIAPLARTAIRILTADARSLSDAPHRRVALAFATFVVKAARFAHRRRGLRRAESCLASACPTLLVLGTEGTVAQLVFAGTFARDRIATVISRPAVGISTTFVRIGAHTPATAI